jgi:hypothetical protein
VKIGRCGMNVRNGKVGQRRCGFQMEEPRSADDLVRVGSMLLTIVVEVVFVVECDEEEKCNDRKSSDRPISLSLSPWSKRDQSQKSRITWQSGGTSGSKAIRDRC